MKILAISTILFTTSFHLAFGQEEGGCDALEIENAALKAEIEELKAKPNAAKAAGAAAPAAADAGGAADPADDSENSAVGDFGTDEEIVETVGKCPCLSLICIPKESISSETSKCLSSLLLNVSMLQCTKMS